VRWCSASTGLQPILDVVPQALHQRTPLVIGSREDVALVESFIQERLREKEFLAAAP
jgi:fructose-1,6-bisphosphatase I